VLLHYADVAHEILQRPHQLNWAGPHVILRDTPSTPRLCRGHGLDTQGPAAQAGSSDKAMPLPRIDSGHLKVVLITLQYPRMYNTSQSNGCSGQESQ
jgi:hypothetical protein